MSDVHLTKERWADLLTGRIPAADRPAILQHLESPCDACEQFLAEAAERGEIDALDGLTDDALLGVTKSEPPAIDDLAFARFDRAIRIRSARRFVRPLIGVAAVVMVAMFVDRMPSPESESPGREKGVAPRIERAVKLEVLRSRNGRLLPIADRSSVSPGDALAFEVEIANAACVTLRRTRSGKTEELLDAPLCLPPGKHVLERAGQALGLPITADDKGEITISAAIEGGHEDAVTVRVLDPSGGP